MTLARHILPLWTRRVSPPAPLGFNVVGFLFVDHLWLLGFSPCWMRTRPHTRLQPQTGMTTHWPILNAEVEGDCVVIAKPVAVVSTRLARLSGAEYCPSTVPDKRCFGQGHETSTDDFLAQISPATSSKHESGHHNASITPASRQHHASITLASG